MRTSCSRLCVSFFSVCPLSSFSALPLKGSVRSDQMTRLNSSRHLLLVSEAELHGGSGHERSSGSDKGGQLTRNQRNYSFSRWSGLDRGLDVKEPVRRNTQRVKKGDSERSPTGKQTNAQQIGGRERNRSVHVTSSSRRMRKKVSGGTWIERVTSRRGRHTLHRGGRKL